MNQPALRVVQPSTRRPVLQVASINQQPWMLRRTRVPNYLLVMAAATFLIMGIMLFNL